MSKVFITGASGFLGKTLVRKLLFQGYEVVALTHNTPLNIDHPNLRLINGNILQLESFTNSLKGVSIIFHLAGVVTDWAPSQKYFDVHLQGTKNIVDSAIKNNIRSIVYISTIDIFSYENHVPINENTPFTISKAPYRNSKLLAYEYLMDVAQKGKISPIILCPSWIYGPGDKIFISEIVKQLEEKSFMYVGKKQNFVPLIYTENLATLMIEISQKQIPYGESPVFIVSDVNVTWENLVKIICDIKKISYPKWSLPYSVSYLIAFILEVWGHLVKKTSRPLLTRTSVETIGRSVKVDSKKIIDFLNYKSDINLQTGIQMTLHS